MKLTKYNIAEKLKNEEDNNLFAILYFINFIFLFI